MPYLSGAFESIDMSQADFMRGLKYPSQNARGAKDWLEGPRSLDDTDAAAYQLRRRELSIWRRFMTAIMCSIQHGD